MATIGALGNISFSVSRGTVKTFDAIKWSSSARYAKHNRHLKKTLLEYTGSDEDSISFTMLLSAHLGVNPLTELKKLQSAMDSAKTMPLAIGAKVYGKYRWVITKLQKDMERFDKKGNLLAVKVSVSLEEYVKR